MSIKVIYKILSKKEIQRDVANCGYLGYDRKSTI